MRIQITLDINGEPDEGIEPGDFADLLLIPNLNSVRHEVEALCRHQPDLTGTPGWVHYITTEEV